MMEADWTDLKVEYLDRAQPKYKRVDLGKMKENGERRGRYRDYYNAGYNMAIDDIKTKYGDLYAEVK